MNEASGSPLFKGLLDRLGVPEDSELEFKAARGGLPNSVWETVSAFANTNGGWIILGIEDAPPFTVSGVARPSEMLQQFHNLARNPNKISAPVCGASDATIETVDGASVIAIRVPAAPLRSRPIYVSNNPYGGTYVRRHTGDFHCSKPEVDRMMREASDESTDSKILSGYTIEDLDRGSLANYRRRFQTSSPESPWNAYDDQRFLIAIRAYRRDRQTGIEGLTAAGLLLVGSEAALRDWRGRHLIDFRLISKEADIDARWDDRVAWEGNLLGAFEAIYPRLVDKLPVPFRLQGGARVDQSPVHVALREALVNLLVHADYAEQEVSLIRRFPEGYSFRNPGSSRVSVDDLIGGDRSDPRNPDLVKMFRLIGLAEEAGSGMAKIIGAWRELGLQLPEIDVGTERYEFSLELRHVHFIHDDDRAWLRQLGDDWSEPEQLALVYARHSGAVDTSTLRRMTGLHLSDLARILRDLCERGLLHINEAGRRTQYELSRLARSGRGHVPLMTSEQLGLPLRVGSSSDSASKTLSSGGKDSNSGGKSSSSGGKGSNSGGKSSSSGGKRPRSGVSDTRDEGGEQTDIVNIQEQLEKIASRAAEYRRLPAITRDEIVIALCALKPLSLHEIASLMGRDEETLRDPIRRLVATGRLAFLYPDRPSHPQQRYVVRPE
jgi:ATP-dependent DNA helicase RecG